MPGMGGGLLLALTLLGTPAHEPQLALELRVFNGAEDVTAQTRVAVHRAGDRAHPLVLLEAGHAVLSADVPPGIYDVQAIREREGRVVAIRWAERLVVMKYPDEHGRHLEVINFQPGFGALEVRGAGGIRPDAEVFQPADHTRPTTAPVTGPSSLVFVLPAGTYDLLTREAGVAVWNTGIEVPLDRTRFWLLPERQVDVRSVAR